MKERGSIRYKRGGKIRDVGLVDPKPTFNGDRLKINTTNGPDSVDRKELIGFQWDKKTH